MSVITDLGFDFCVPVTIVNRVSSFDGSPCPKCKSPLVSFKSKKNGMIRACKSCKKLYNKKDAKANKAGSRPATPEKVAQPKLPSSDFEYVPEDEEGIQQFLRTVPPNKRNFALNLNKIRRGEILRETPWLHHLLGHVKENMKAPNGLLPAFPSNTPDENVYSALKAGKVAGPGLDNLLKDQHFAQAYGTMHPRHLSHLLQGMEFVPGDKAGVGSVKGDVKNIRPESRGYITPDILKRAVASYEPDTSKGSVDSQSKPGARIKLAPASKPTKVAKSIPRTTTHGYEVGASFAIASGQFVEPFVLLKIEDGRVHFSHPKMSEGATMDFEKFSKLHKPSVAVVDFASSGIPSLSMGDAYGVDFAGDVDETELGGYPDSGLDRSRKGNQTKNEKAYLNDEQFRTNADKFRNHFAYMNKLSKDVTADPKIRTAPTFSDSLENLWNHASGKHAAALQHGYALAYPEEAIGKPGYPVRASDAVRRHMDTIHNNYYSTENPGQPVPPVSESATAPARIRKGPESEDLKSNLNRILKFEDLHGTPFVASVLSRLHETHPEHINGMDSPNGEFTPYAHRLDKLKSGTLDRSKLDNLMRDMYHTHGAVTGDQLLQHVLPHITHDTILKPLASKTRDAILKSEKAAKDVGVEEMAARRAEKERIEQEAVKGGARSSVNPPAEVHNKIAKFSKYLTPNSTFVTPQGTYKPMGKANLTLGSGKQPVVSFKLVKSVAGQHARGMMHIPVDKLREFIGLHHRTPAQLSSSEFSKTMPQSMPSYVYYSK